MKSALSDSHRLRRSNHSTNRSCRPISPMHVLHVADSDISNICRDNDEPRDYCRRPTSLDKSVLRRSRFAKDFIARPAIGFLWSTDNESAIAYLVTLNQRRVTDYSLLSCRSNDTGTGRSADKARLIIRPTRCN